MDIKRYKELAGVLNEGWDKTVKVSPAEKGKYEDDTVAELRSQLAALKKSGPHKQGSKEYGKMRELQFAIRAKTGWGKVNENIGSHLESMSDSELIELCDDVFGEDWTQDVCQTVNVRGQVRLTNRDQIIKALASIHDEAVGESIEEAVGVNTPGERAAQLHAGEDLWRAQMSNKSRKLGVWLQNKKILVPFKTAEARDEYVKQLIGMGSKQGKDFLIINEAFTDDEDDGLSSAEKALIAKADTDLAKKGIKVKKFNPEEMVGKKKTGLDTEIEDSEKEEKEAAEKKTTTKVAVKKETKPAAEPKAKGRKADAGSKSGKARDWLKQNKGATRKMFITYATDKLGMSAAHANTAFYLLKKKLVEGFVLRHPSIERFLLAENAMMGQYQWVDPNSDLEIVVKASEKEAQKVQRYMDEFKNQKAVIMKVAID